MRNQGWGKELQWGDMMEHEERFYLMLMDALDDGLGANEQAELEDHMRVCPDCQQDWRTLMAIESLFRQTPLLLPALGFAERTIALLPGRRTRRLALGSVFVVLLLSGILPLVLAVLLAVRYSPVLSQPELLGGIWSSLVGTGRATLTVVEALIAGVGHFMIEQPAWIGWMIVLAGIVFLWGGVFQRLLAQPTRNFSRN